MARFSFDGKRIDAAKEKAREAVKDAAEQTTDSIFDELEKRGMPGLNFDIDSFNDMNISDVDALPDVTPVEVAPADEPREGPTPPPMPRQLDELAESVEPVTPGSAEDAKFLKAAANRPPQAEGVECPRCASTAFAEGRLETQGQYGPVPIYFHNLSGKASGQRREVRAYRCEGCGHLLLNSPTG